MPKFPCLRKDATWGARIFENKK